MAGRAASRARVTAARTRSGSISGARRRRFARRTGGSAPARQRALAKRQVASELLGELAARELGFLDQRIDGADHFRSLEGLLQDGVAAGAPGFVFVEWLQQSGGKHHANVLETRLVFHVAAKLEAGFAGQENVGEDQVGIDVGQPQHGGVAIGEADHFEAFFAQDPLAHTLRVRAVVSQENSAHRISIRWSGGFDVARRGCGRARGVEPSAAQAVSAASCFLFLLRVGIWSRLLRCRLGGAAGCCAARGCGRSGGSWVAGSRCRGRIRAGIGFGIERGRIAHRSGGHFAVESACGTGGLRHQRRNGWPQVGHGGIARTRGGAHIRTAPEAAESRANKARLYAMVLLILHAGNGGFFGFRDRQSRVP